MNSLTPTQTPSSTPPIKVASSLILQMHAEDYDDVSVPQRWNNRASNGAFDFNNGDFTTTGSAATYPYKQVIQGAPAVVFNYSLNGVAARVESGSPWFPIGMYGGSDWSIEAWIYQDVTQGENAVMQW